MSVPAFLDVTANGVTANTTTDQKAAIDAVIALAVTNGGGVVYFPPGTYYTSGGHDIPALVHIKGAEPTSRYVVYTTAVPITGSCVLQLVPVASGTQPAAMFTVGATSTCMSIEDIQLIGLPPGTGSPPPVHLPVGVTVHGIAFATPGQEHNFRATNVAIIGFTGDGIRGRLWATRWDHIYVGSNHGAGLNCDSSFQWTDSWFTASIITGNVNGGLSISSTGHSAQLNFTDCRFERSGWNNDSFSSPTNALAHGISVTGNLSDSAFIGCSTDANSGNGVNLTRASSAQNVHDIGFTGCRFERDGFGTMSGGSGSAPNLAAVYISGGGTSDTRINCISFVNCFTAPGKAADDGSVPSYTHPRYGVYWAYQDFPTWIGGAISNDHATRWQITSIYKPAVYVAGGPPNLVIPEFDDGSHRASPLFVGEVGWNDSSGKLEVYDGVTPWVAVGP